MPNNCHFSPQYNPRCTLRRHCLIFVSALEASNKLPTTKVFKISVYTLQTNVSRSVFCKMALVSRISPNYTGQKTPSTFRVRRTGWTILAKAANTEDSSSKTTPSPAPQVRPVRDKDLGVGLKAAWFGAELFGDLLAQGKTTAGQRSSEAAAPASGMSTAAVANAGAAGGVKTVEQVLDSIRADYAEDYFISGKGEMAGYDPNCLFADPFVSFRGVDRFKKNVANLGAMISDVDLQITKWDVNDNSLEAHWRFSAVLDLPWRPRLAAAGSTTHVIDPSKMLVVEHIERWKSEPGEVVKRLLRPAAKIPTNEWESFMANLSEGDAKGCWYVVNRKVALYAAPVVALAVILHAATGHGLPGILGGGVVEVLAGALLVAGLGTEAYKYIEGTGQI